MANSGWPEDPIFRGRRRGQRRATRGADMEASESRKQVRTGRSQGLGSGRGPATRITWSDSHAVRVFPAKWDQSSVRLRSIVGGRERPSRRWGGCCSKRLVLRLFPCSPAEEACVPGACLFSSGGEVSVLPFLSCLGGPARRSAPWLLAARNVYSHGLRWCDCDPLPLTVIFSRLSWE